MHGGPVILCPMSYPVLKEKHSLLGKGVLPVIMEMKVAGTDLPNPLARLKKDHPLDSYKPDEIVSEFKRLTGEDVKDVLLLAGRTDTMDNTLHAMHLAIIHANTVGAPRGAVLTQQNPTTPTVTVVPEVMHGNKGQKRSLEDDPDTLEGRMRRLEDGLASHHRQSTEEALKSVRILASRPKLTAPGALISALELLVENATVGGHPEKDYYSKALAACRQHEEHPDVCGLCLKLLGSSDDRKISASVCEWAKTCRQSVNCKQSANESGNGKGEANTTPKSTGFVPPFYPHSFPMPYPQVTQPVFPFGGAPYPMGPTAVTGYPPFSPPGGFRNPIRQGGRARTPRKQGPCYICGKMGHLMNNCQQVKKE